MKRTIMLKPIRIEQKGGMMPKIKRKTSRLGREYLHIIQNSVSSQENIKSRWYGPYTVSKVFPYGAIEVNGKDGGYFKVNGQRAKIYYGEENHSLSDDVFFKLT